MLFADRYRDELAGMLLVDPAFPHQGEQMAQVAGVSALMKQTLPDFGPCEAAARAHRRPTSPPLVDLCLNHGPSCTPSLISALDAVALRPTYWSDLESEVGSFESTPGAAHADLDSPEFEGVPAVRCPAVDRPDGRDRIALPGLTPTQADALFRIWNHGHDMIASRSSEGRNQVVPHSSHDIQFYQPGAVIDAIRELVDKARSGTRALPVRD